jgi:hypothetical protein
MEVARHPISLFPAIDSSDPEWNFRIAHYGHMLGDLAEETLCGTIRFMNVQHHYQILLCHGMSQLTSIAQGHYRNADRQVTQIEELQALVTEKEEIITERDETIIHREDQINESDAISLNVTQLSSSSKSKSMTLSLRLTTPMLTSMNFSSSQYLLLYL